MFFDSFNVGKHIHMIGIGGISMSGLAEVLINKGYSVSGSDLRSSNITKKLEKSGVNFHQNHDAKNVIGADAVVYTAAVKSDNLEYQKAVELNIPLIDRATLLGDITKLYNKSIAISGTHGKTTTTSMIATIFLNANYDPTIMVGGELDKIDGNYNIGNSQYLVTEACEYVESFLKFYPQTEVILNIEADHLDYFRDLEHIKSAFSKFMNKLPSDGILVINGDDKNCDIIKDSCHCDVLTYGIKNSCDLKAENINFDSNGYPIFDVVYLGKKLGTIPLNVLGFHNIYNALASIGVSLKHNINFEVIKDSLIEFGGAHRRFEFKGKFNDVAVFDDYAHHPSEIKATLSAAKNKNAHKIWCIFQPHTYSRTKALLSEFASAFTNADNVIITDIYAAREKNTGEIHSKNLVDEINKTSRNAIYMASFDEIAEYVKKNAVSGDIVLTVGAGDIYNVGEKIVG